MKIKTKYIVFYLAGLAEWALIFYFFSMLHVSPRRLWTAYLLIAVMSAVGSLAMYATRRVGDYAVRLKYRAFITLALVLSVGACLWWTLVLSRGQSPLSLDAALGATFVMFVGVSWLAYRAILRSKNPPGGQRDSHGQSAS